ncbi:MAG: hypothetical protein ACKO37_02670, partial [Vampirovibrionales bacterium]
MIFSSVGLSSPTLFPIQAPSANIQGMVPPTFLATQHEGYEDTHTLGQGTYGANVPTSLHPSKRLPRPSEAIQWVMGGAILRGGIVPVLKTLKLVPKPVAHAFKHNLTQDELQVYSYFSAKASSLFRIGMMSPERIPLLLGYAGFSALGFVAGNVLDGLKEAWVRWEESCIRAELLSQLQKTIKQGITKNYKQEDMLHTQAHQRIVELLQQAGVGEVSRYLPAVPPSEQGLTHTLSRESLLRTQQHASIEPTAQGRNLWQSHTLLESPHTEGSRFGEEPSLALHPSSLRTATTNEKLPEILFKSETGTPLETPRTSNSPIPTLSSSEVSLSTHWNARMGKALEYMNGGLGIRLGLGSLGFALGHVVHNILQALLPISSLKPLTASPSSPPIATLPVTEATQYSHGVALPKSSATSTLKGIKNIETVSLYDGEAFFLLFLNELKQNRWLVGSFFALGAMTKLLQAALTGLREIEVTRLNAKTEDHYQAYNWQTLNPQFRLIAEQA